MLEIENFNGQLSQVHTEPKSWSSISEEEYMADYSIFNYPTYAVAAGTVLFSILTEAGSNYRKTPEYTLAVLLVRRRAHPQRGLLAVPGGFLRPEETIEECALREIEEETGVLPDNLVPTGVFSSTDRDPRGRIISHAFLSVLAETVLPSPGGDAVEADWYTVRLSNKGKAYDLLLEKDGGAASAELLYSEDCANIAKFRTVKNEELAFDHAEMICSAVTELRKHVSDFEWLFRFLPEKFTLNDMQQVYETVMGEKVLTANFRRKAAEHISETDEYTAGTGHRPARLYVKKEM